MYLLQLIIHLKMLKMWLGIWLCSRVLASMCKALGSVSRHTHTKTKKASKLLYQVYFKIIKEFETVLVGEIFAVQSMRTQVQSPAFT